MNNFIFPDVSFWQDDPTTPLGIDFNKMRQQTSAVFIRAGQNLWTDREFKENWHNAKVNGLSRGSYWFYDSRANPKRQAEKYIEVLGNDLGELPLWCDFEDTYGGVYGKWADWFDFMERIKALVPDVDLGVYTRASYFNLHVPVTVNYFNQYPLWVAHYKHPVTGFPDKPDLPRGWSMWAVWQYTDNGIGVPYGVESRNIDLNYFNGTEAEFYLYFNAKPHLADKTVIANFRDKKVLYKEKS